ncbi:hypothetical protein J2755_000084 [Methanohalophilus levihalophilus]|uniref:hypothetical protein n=1 Tax=Methanohalophilus levihalophilus TaxID=1431282 RepID=UPI001AE3E3B3|nr:hypothetical protein [Methanohalophilus levihalophilus]MBP2029164.1 hypothetical protein [Methanohalophilus levihalophilus]
MERIHDFSWKKCGELCEKHHEGIIAIPLSLQKKDPHSYALEQIKADMIVDSFKYRIAKMVSEDRAGKD